MELRLQAPGPATANDDRNSRDDRRSHEDDHSVHVGFTSMAT
jgi:hypothetical protein